MDFMLNLTITEHKWTYSKGSPSKGPHSPYQAHRKLSKHTRDNPNWQSQPAPLDWNMVNVSAKKSLRPCMFLRNFDMVGGPLEHVDYCTETGRFSMKSIFKSWFLSSDSLTLHNRLKDPTFFLFGRP